MSRDNGTGSDNQLVKFFLKLDLSSLCALIPFYNVSCFIGNGLLLRQRIGFPFAPLLLLRYKLIVQSFPYVICELHDI